MPWWDGAIQRPGPLNKTGGYSWGNNRDDIGVVVHSAEGGLKATLNRIASTAQVSWHFTVAKNGDVYQHYEDITLSCWHARATANRKHVGIENVGVAGEPLTQAQVDSLVSLITWISANDTAPWPGFIRHTTLFEHNEYVATSCPSGRIPWTTLISQLNGEPGQPTGGLDREALQDAATALGFFAHADFDLATLGDKDKDAIRDAVTRF